MARPTYTVPFGRDSLDISLPSDWEVEVADAHVAAPDPPPESPSVSFGPPLRDLAGPSTRALIAFTDATRLSPDRIMLRLALRELEAAGVPDENITLLCAVGMHRPSTRREKLAKIGPDAISRYNVADHRPADVVDLGAVPLDALGPSPPFLDTRDDVPIQLNKLVADADLVIATGIVEPHQYAGYSGGVKTVIIGCAGPETIGITHGPRFVGHRGVVLGKVADNPFQNFLRAAAQIIGKPDYIVNAIADPAGNPVELAVGDPIRVHDHLVGKARELFEVKVNKRFDIVIAGVGHPKDVNLYQASRAATYIGLSRAPAIRNGGVIILPAPCPEGAGAGIGERNFFRALADSKSPSALVEAMTGGNCLPGQQRALLLARLLERVNVIVVGASDPDMIRAAHLIPADTVDQAIEIAGGMVGRKPRTLIVPHATQTMPVYEPDKET